MKVIDRDHIVILSLDKLRHTQRWLRIELRINIRMVWLKYVPDRICVAPGNSQPKDSFLCDPVSNQSSTNPCITVSQHSTRRSLYAWS